MQISIIVKLGKAVGEGQIASQKLMSYLKHAYFPDLPPLEEEDNVNEDSVEQGIEEPIIEEG